MEVFAGAVRRVFDLMADEDERGDLFLTSRAVPDGETTGSGTSVGGSEGPSGAASWGASVFCDAKNNHNAPKCRIRIIMKTVIQVFFIQVEILVKRHSGRNQPPHSSD
jgi:hypothetical protein